MASVPWRWYAGFGILVRTNTQNRIRLIVHFVAKIENLLENPTNTDRLRSTETQGRLDIPIRNRKRTRKAQFPTSYNDGVSDHRYLLPSLLLLPMERCDRESSLPVWDAGVWLDESSFVDCLRLTKQFTGDKDTCDYKPAADKVDVQASISWCYRFKKKVGYLVFCFKIRYSLRPTRFWISAKNTDRRNINERNFKLNSRSSLFGAPTKCSVWQSQSYMFETTRHLGNLYIRILVYYLDDGLNRE